MCNKKHERVYLKLIITVQKHGVEFIKQETS